MNEDDLLNSYEEEEEESANVEYVEYTPSFISTLLSTFWSTLKIVIAIVLIAGFLIGGSGLGIITAWISTSKILNEEDLAITTGLTTFIHDYDGNIIGTLTEVIILIGKLLLPNSFQKYLLMLLWLLRMRDFISIQVLTL